jgi:hypothetical protein
VGSIVVGLFRTGAGKSRKVIQNVLYQNLSTRILCSRRRSKKVEKITRLLRRFQPCRGRDRYELRFEFFLSDPQGLFVGLDLRKKAPYLGCLQG